MNKNNQDEFRRNSSEEIKNDQVLETNDSSKSNDGPSPTLSTYELVLWFYYYSKMFIFRLAKDLTQLALSYFYSEQILPDHILELIRVQQAHRKQSETQISTCCRYNLITNLYILPKSSSSTQTISLVPERIVGPSIYR